MSKYKLEELISKAIELYNRLHGAEAQAKVISVRENGEVVVEFMGSFCYTCGVRDWVEDLAYLIKSMGYNAELVDYIEPGGEDHYYRRIGVFKVTVSGDDVERE